MDEVILIMGYLISGIAISKLYGTLTGFIECFSVLVV